MGVVKIPFPRPRCGSVPTRTARLGVRRHGSRAANRFLEGGAFVEVCISAQGARGGCAMSCSRWRAQGKGPRGGCAIGCFRWRAQAKGLRGGYVMGCFRWRAQGKVHVGPESAALVFRWRAQ